MSQHSAIPVSEIVPGTSGCPVMDARRVVQGFWDRLIGLFEINFFALNWKKWLLRRVERYGSAFMASRASTSRERPARRSA